MNWSIYIRFSIMMLLQYAIWGAWGSYLTVYLGAPVDDGGLGFSAVQYGYISSMLYFASMFAPFIGGQIADRYMASEKYLGISQLVGGVLMFVLAEQTQYWPFLIIMFMWSVFYAPTIPLTNAICLQNLKDSEREFGAIRLWGTIGWILAGWALSGWLYLDSDGANCLRLSGVASIILGLFSFALPNTPPKGSSGSPFAFLEAFKLLKDPTIFIFMAISFVVATELMFYYVLTGPFLADIGISGNDVPWIMTLGQIGEMFALLVLLPLVLPKLGIKWSIAIGIIAWPVRYVIFAIGEPTWLVISSLPLHGICYVFFFVVGQIFIDKVAPKDIRNSAQSLLAFVTFGIGLTFGAVFAGWVQAFFTVDDVVNWTYVFIVPVVLTVICALVFLVVFKEPKKNETPPEAPEAVA